LRRDVPRRPGACRCRYPPTPPGVPRSGPRGGRGVPGRRRPGGRRPA
jgi:hypothetical protein